MRRGRVFVVLALTALAFVMAVLQGCGSLTGKLTGTRLANEPPNTVLFVSGPLDTVNHVVHLYWFGSDPDGNVSGFEWQLQTNPRTPGDDVWHFTTLTDTVFTIQTPTGYTAPTFSVRAVDNVGARDPSPSIQDFQFSNQAPTVRITGKPLPTDTTFASVSVIWSGTDVDGDASKLVYLVWLDGNEATPEITTATSFTMPSDRFLVGGVLTPGPRKLFVRAIDDGGRAGPPDSCVWNVRSAGPNNHNRLLIVDDVPRGTAANLRFDTLYTNSAARVGLSASQYLVLRLDSSQPFRTSEDFRQTFKLFDAVVWYRGIEVTFSTLLRTAEPGIASYLDGGGRFYVDGLYLIAGRNAVGPLSEDFVRSHLNSRGMIGAFTGTLTFADTTIGFGNTGESVFLPHVDVHGAIARDSAYVLQVLQARPGEAGGLRQFDFLDREQVVLWGAPGTLTPDLGDSTAVGISVPQPNGGRAIVVCVPPGASVNTTGPRNVAGSAAKFVTNIFRHLGLDTP